MAFINACPTSGVNERKKEKRKKEKKKNQERMRMKTLQRVVESFLFSYGNENKKKEDGDELEAGKVREGSNGGFWKHSYSHT